MNITVKKTDFPSHVLSSDGQSEMLPGNCLNLVQHVEVTCHIRLGTLTLTIGELQQLSTGQIIPLQQSMHEPLEVVVNQHVIAKGELLSHDHCFAIHITEVCK